MNISLLTPLTLLGKFYDKSVLMRDDFPTPSKFSIKQILCMVTVSKKQDSNASHFVVMMIHTRYQFPDSIL